MALWLIILLSVIFGPPVLALALKILWFTVLGITAIILIVIGWAIKFWVDLSR